jgi:hypothetical protein
MIRDNVAHLVAISKPSSEPGPTRSSRNKP